MIKMIKILNFQHTQIKLLNINFTMRIVIKKWSKKINFKIKWIIKMKNLKKINN